MRIVNGVEEYDEPQYPDIDWDAWYQSHCDVCKWFEVCDIIWEMGINGWSKSVVTVGDTVECTGFEEVCQSGLSGSPAKGVD